MTKAAYIKYREGYKYQLAEDYSIQTNIKPEKEVQSEYIILAPAGLLIIKKGYAWDGASGPTIDTKSSMRGSLVHDALYQLVRMGLIDTPNRDYADELLRKICIEDGMWRIRANVWWTIVDKFAGLAIRPSSEPQIMIAP
jgi:hypothetical protein